MSQFRNLVFEGGGVKGVAYGGALEALEEARILDGIERVAGTSAGAITAALVAVGASSHDVANVLATTDFRRFQDDSIGALRDTARLLSKYGWYKGDAFIGWFKNLLEKFAGKADLTFAELNARLTDTTRKYRDLYVVGTNLSRQRSQVYSVEETPDMPIWEAVRISMSIPLFFASVVQTDGIFVDGGVTRNYPISLFDDQKYLSPGSEAFAAPFSARRSASHVYNKETLGFRLATRDEILAETEGVRLPPVKIEGIIDYIKVLVGFTMDMANQVHLNEDDWHRTIFIDVEGVRTTEFDLSQQKIQMLLQNGRKGVKAYLDWFNDPEPEVVPLNQVDE